MQYLLMCCIDEKRWMALPAAERDGVMRDYGSWIQETERASQHRATGKLASSAAAKTIRMRDGKSVITDGPFAETKEQFGGYHLVECSDLDEAMALALRIPTLRVGGTIEVRALEPPV
ncbi:MAG: YciI family protein [Steroidobacteraceae bacterium]